MGNPEIFNTVPQQTGEKKVGQLSDDRLKEYFDKGFLVVENFFTKEELDDCKDAICKLVDDLANRLYAAGKIKDLHKEYGFYQRLTRIENDFPGANILLHKHGKLPQAFRNLLGNERMLNLLEQLIGPDIAASPVWNLRTKTPNNEATVVPWHQDSAYFDDCSYDMLIPTAWVPLLDATPENGTLQVIQRGQKSGKVATHQCCAGGTWYVMLEEEEMEKTLGVNMKTDVVTCTVPYGGFVLFSNILPHRSLPNISKDIRWAIDLRWQQTGKPYCLWGLKDGVTVRSSKELALRPDWETFDSVDRNREQQKAVGKHMSEFDATIQGPWMNKWELVHHNKHTKLFLEMQEGDTFDRP